MELPINKIAKLTVIGAGPGDPDLITLKATKVLATADVVLYDALINESLLTYAPNAQHIFVGKRFGCHAYTQTQINELIVSSAMQFGHVVRLKGGDPFVFGRGSEEIAHAVKHGLETAIVPGISSSMAVPAINGISLTQRGIAESFWVITGTTSDHKLSKDVTLAAQSSATVVILMGMHKLVEILSVFKSVGSDDLPIGIIQNGTTVKQKKVIGKLSTIRGLVDDSGISSPAIIVIGEVVGAISYLSEYLHEVDATDEFIYQNLGI
jgi:uroporphyrin-III C-methyltransferase